MTTDSKVIPLTRIQKIIGKRMLYSKQTKPCFYLEVRADVTDMLHIRRRASKELGIKVTTNTFYLYALARAIEKYPLVAGVIEGDNIKIPNQVNMGFAVNAPHGLVVPVLKDAAAKGLLEIGKQERELTEKARDNKLTPAEMTGQCIALSNLGPYGIDSFIAIVPPDTTGIISIGNAADECVPIDGEIHARKMLSIHGAFDHAVVNGAYAGRFLKYFADMLGKPETFLPPHID